MPAKNPRVQVTVSPHVYAVLKRLSAVSDESISSIVGGLLEPSVSSLERLCSFLERAKVAPDEHKEGIVRGFEMAVRRMDEMAEEMEQIMKDQSQPPLL